MKTRSYIMAESETTDGWDWKVIRLHFSNAYYQPLPLWT